MKKILFAIATMVLLSACSNTVTTTSTGADGKPKKIEMSEEVFIETERLKTNKFIIEERVNLVEKGQDARQARMDKPLFTLQFTSMNCGNMKDGNCLVEMSQPVTTEMLKADANATTAQLSKIQTIKAPTNINDFGIAVAGGVERVLTTGVQAVADNAVTIGFVKMNKVGVKNAGGNTSNVGSGNSHIENNNDVNNDKSQILNDVDNDKSIFTQTDFNNDKSSVEQPNNSINNSHNPMTTDSHDDNSSAQIKESVEPPVVIEEPIE